MPFTPSHAVVALPFVRGALPPAAVAVGAMAPDLPLFVRGTPLTYAITHSFRWLPLTVLVALVLLLVWRCLLRPAARELSPSWLASRLPAGWDAGAAAGAQETFARRGRSNPTWAGVALVVAALAIGVTTHIVWDWFTHEGRLGTSVVPALDAMWGPLFGFKWLQYGSGVVGLAIIGVWALLWLRRAVPTRFDRSLAAWLRVAWWILLPLILVAACVAGWVVLGPFTTAIALQHLAYRVLLPACAVWGAATLLLCVVVQVRRTRHERRQSAESRGH